MQRPLYAVARWTCADDTLATTCHDITPVRDGGAAHFIAYQRDRLLRRRNGNDPCEGYQVLYWIPRHACPSWYDLAPGEAGVWRF